MKQALLILLAVFTMTACGNKKTDAVKTTADTSLENTEIVSVAAADSSTVYVYYFHGKQRCKTCIVVQNHSKEAIEQMYGDNKNVQFLEVLIEDAGYKGLVEKYGVSWSTLIVAKGDDYIDITQNSFANPEGVKELLKTEIDRRL
ncbi:MAG: nitrophenyl compound nitroreductase subunit ArsF family protein [Porphyromonadaceae bacterium]|nr:nitrophenyl compound nitroreductase subunit ArsF family protein [Porphyromonadaceae bacterium]